MNHADFWCGEGTDILMKAFTNALVLTLRNLAVSNPVKNKATVNALGVYIIYSHKCTLLPLGSKVSGVLYTTSAWGFRVARFDWMGDARAS